MAPADAPLAALRGTGRVHLFADGHLFAGSHAAVGKTRRHAASLLLAASDKDFEIEIDGRRERHAAVAIRPFVAKQLIARDVPFVCIDLTPDHAEFRSFAAIGGNGCQGFAREHFAGLASALREFHDGRTVSTAESHRLFRRATHLATSGLPTPAPLDRRVQLAKTLLSRDPALSAEALARACCLSLHRMSHLFSEQQGITLRHYMQWLKIVAAARLFGSQMNLTQIAAAAGFADSAHFSRVWSQAYGVPPAYFFSHGEVSMHAPRQASRFRSLNAPNSQERMPTTSV